MRTKTLSKILLIFWDFFSNSKNNNCWSLFFLNSPEHYATIWTKKWKLLFQKRGGLCIFLTRKRPKKVMGNLFPTKDMQTASPLTLVWPHFYGRCAMCWIEWKTIFGFLLLRVIVKNSLKIDVQKWPYLIKKKRFFFRFSTFRIFHVNLNAFEIKRFVQISMHFWRKRNTIFFSRQGALPPNKIQPGPGYFFLMIKNRLAPMAYFAKLRFSASNAWVKKIIFLFQSGQIYMKDSK